MSARRTLIRTATLAVLALGAPSAAADQRVEKSLALEPGGRLEFDGDDASVVVTGTGGSTARLVAVSDVDIETKFDLSMEATGRGVRVVARPKAREWSLLGSWKSSPSLRVEIEIPSETDLEIATADGFVEISGLRGRAEIATSDGAVSVSDHDGPLNAATSDGAVRLMNVQGDARIATSDGAVHVVDLTGNLKASTSDGAIRIEKISGSLTVATSDGSVTVSDAVGDVNAATSDGSIEIGSVVGSVSANSSDGNISIEDAAGRVEAESSDGSISVTVSPGNANGGRLVTSRGNIHLKLDPSAGLDLDARAEDGEILCSLPLAGETRVGSSHLAGRIGAGGPRLTLRAGDGSIRIDGL